MTSAQTQAPPRPARLGAPNAPLHPLVAEGVEVDFDGLVALRAVTMRVDVGEIVGLIGPNGAGKTTLLNVLSGFQTLTKGAVRLGDQDITTWSPQKRCAAGVARTFQSVRLFSRLSALENVEAAAFLSHRRTRDARRMAESLLDRLGLGHVAHLDAAALPYGAERRLGIARALASSPTFLLLDEPAAGLNEAETDDLLVVIRDLRRDFGCGIVVIEHDMRLIMQLCERIHVLDHGETLSIGSPAVVRSDHKVIEAYLGKDPDA